MPTQAEVKKMFRETCNKAEELGHPQILFTGWILTFNNRKAALGLCSYTKKEVQISRHFLKLRSYEEILNTVSHEVAHALVGSKEGHGPRWVRLHKQLGGNGERCANLAPEQRPAHSWELVNTLTDVVVAKYHRKPRRNPKGLMLKNQPETLGKLILRRKV